jgi:hypothetical protein
VGGVERARPSAGGRRTQGQGVNRPGVRCPADPPLPLLVRPGRLRTGGRAPLHKNLRCRAAAAGTGKPARHSIREQEGGHALTGFAAAKSSGPPAQDAIPGRLFSSSLPPSSFRGTSQHFYFARTKGRPRAAFCWASPNPPLRAVVHSRLPPGPHVAGSRAQPVASGSACCGLSCTAGCLRVRTRTGLSVSLRVPRHAKNACLLLYLRSRTVPS